jgi:hypothetical protein
MRALGLGLLLVGSLVLLWPWYGHFIHFFTMTRSDTEIYGGAGLMAGVTALVVSRVRAR